MWTHLKAVPLVHQEPLPLGGVSHLLGVLWHQWIEVGIVLLCNHPWTGRQVEVEELCSCSLRDVDGYVISVSAWCKFFGFLCKRTDLSWLVRLCQASGPPVCVIHHGRKSESKHWLLASQRRCHQPVRQRAEWNYYHSAKVAACIDRLGLYKKKTKIFEKEPIKEIPSQDWDQTMKCQNKLRIHLMMKKIVSYGSVYLHAHCVQITVNTWIRCPLYWPERATRRLKENIW